MSFAESLPSGYLLFALSFGLFGSTPNVVSDQANWSVLSVRS